MKRCKFFILLFVLILSSLSVSAIRISPDSIRIEFEPNFEQTYTFATGQAENVGVNIEGPLAEYVSLEENNIAKDGTFLIKVSLPEDIDPPGKHLVFVGLTEAGKGGGTVSARAAIRTPIDIRVPYIGIYAQSSFNAVDVKINETAEFIVTMANLGKLNITDAKSIIDIMNGKGEKVDTIESQENFIITKSTGNIISVFDPSKHVAGNYKAIAHLSYEGQNKDLEDTFRIGSLNIEIVNFTKNFIKKDIVNFDLEVESGWNSQISNIFAEIKIFNNSKELSSFKTVSFDLEPWERKEVSTFWETHGMGEGAYDAEITLFYQGSQSKSNGKVYLRIPKEKMNFVDKYVTTTNLLIFAVVLLILINLIVLLKKRR